MVKVKPWESAYAFPEFRAPKMKLDALETQAHPVTSTSVVILHYRHGQPDLKKAVNTVIRTHRICRVNHGWHPDGWVITFKTLRDADLFRIAWARYRLSNLHETETRSH